MGARGKEKIREKGKKIIQKEKKELLRSSPGKKNRGKTASVEGVFYSAQEGKATEWGRRTTKTSDEE